MSKLVVMVPGDRRACGRASLFSREGHVLLGPFRVLATANVRLARKNHNPTRDERLRFGHPPSGSYLVVGSLPPGYVHPRRPLRFGVTGSLVLAPRAGKALTAVQHGRTFFYLHGGPSDDRGRLRPTRGGLRISDADMTALLDAVNRAYRAGDPVSSLELIDATAARAISDDDAIGKGRPFVSRHRGAKHVRTPERRRSSIAHAALVLGGCGLLKEREGERPPADPSRRRLFAQAIALLGGVGLAACGGSSEDDPSPCQPVACDPADSWCPPDGYVCPDDVGGGAGLGVAGGATDPGTAGGDSSGDSSGGSG